MPLPFEHSADQVPAGEFVEGSFRRAYPKSYPPGVSVVAGVHKENAPGRSDSGARRVQAVRFDSAAFTEAKAREFLSKRGLRADAFDPALPQSGAR